MSMMYLWLQRDESFGHLSLELEDKTYISFWPEDHENNYGKETPSETYSYGKDRDHLHRDPDQTLAIPSGGLNLNKIKSWWEEYRDNYILLKNNCSSVVYKALQVGGYITSSIKHFIVETPEDVFDLVKETIHGKLITPVYNQLKNLGTLMTIAAKYVAAKIKSWWNTLFFFFS